MWTAVEKRGGRRRSLGFAKSCSRSWVTTANGLWPNTTAKILQTLGPRTRNHAVADLAGGEHTVRLLLEVMPRGDRYWSGALRSNELTFCVASSVAVPATRPAP